VPQSNSTTFGTLSDKGERRREAVAGQHKTEARFGGMALGKVKLVKEDGTIIELPLEKLSDEDQQWIEDSVRPTVRLAGAVLTQA
jgi:hypothetical protein